MSWVGWKLKGTSGRFCPEMPTDPFPPVLLQLLSAAPILGPSVQGPVLDSVAPATMATGPALSVGATAYCLGAVSLVVGLAAPVERPRPDWVAQVNLRMFQGKTWLWAHPQRKPCDKPTLNLPSLGFLCILFRETLLFYSPSISSCFSLLPTSPSPLQSPRLVFINQHQDLRKLLMHLSAQVQRNHPS